MAFGSFLYQQQRTATGRAFVRLFGVPDLHTQLRLRPVMKYFSKLHAARGLRVIEIGCGQGLTLLELARRYGVKARGYDLNQRAIDEGKRLVAMYGLPAVELSAAAVDEIVDNGRYDVALLIDVLEHLRDPEQAIAVIDNRLGPGGLLIVSVPTPRYPVIFGRAFHDSVGHLRDGYTLAQLDEVLSPGFRRQLASYTTGVLANLGCALFYRYAHKIRWTQLRKAVIALLMIFSWFDLLNGERMSCSLFAVYRKTE